MFYYYYLQHMDDKNMVLYYYVGREHPWLPQQYTGEPLFMMWDWVQQTKESTDGHDFKVTMGPAMWSLWCWQCRSNWPWVIQKMSFALSGGGRWNVKVTLFDLCVVMRKWEGIKLLVKQWQLVKLKWRVLLKGPCRISGVIQASIRAWRLRQTLIITLGNGADDMGLFFIEWQLIS